MVTIYKPRRKATEEIKIADTFISDIQTPKLGENKSLC
jgi:hypothetical protein